MPLLSFCLSLSRSFVHFLAFSLSGQCLPLSFSLPPILSLSLIVGPRFFLWRGNPSMVARKPPAASLPCCFSAFPFSSPSDASLARAFSLSLLFSRSHSSSLTWLSFLLSLLVARWLVHWFHRCTGPGFVFFLSNYTVTCNRPCQLAAPFFRSSSARFFFSSLRSQDPTWRATPSKGSPREGRGGGERGGDEGGEATRAIGPAN